MLGGVGSGVENWMRLRPAPEYHQSLFGVTEPHEVVSAISRFCADVLDSTVTSIPFYWVSTGAVAGLVLADGREVACKFLPRDLERLDVLVACRSVQARARAHGLPVPEPLIGPIEWDRTTTTVDAWLPSPPPLDARQPAVRAGLARLLHELIECLRGVRQPSLGASRYRLPQDPTSLRPRRVRPARREKPRRPKGRHRNVDHRSHRLASTKRARRPVRHAHRHLRLGRSEHRSRNVLRRNGRGNAQRHIRRTELVGTNAL